VRTWVILMAAVTAAAVRAGTEEAVPKVVVEPAEVGNPARALRAIMGRVVHAHRAELGACQWRRPAEAGTLRLAFRAEPDGRLTAVRAEDRGVLSDCLAACVVDAVAAWRLPAPSQGVAQLVTYPLALPVPGAPDEGERLAPKVPVAPGDRTGLSAARIQASIKTGLDRIKRCWESDLRPCPALHAKVAIRFVIDPRGAVRCADVAQGGSASPELEACVLAAVRALRFPAAPDGRPVTVTYPFIFGHQ